MRLSPGHGPGHRLHRHRQVDHARRDDRPSEPDPEAEHHQPRRPDRVRTPEQEQPGDSTRAGHSHSHLRRRRARGDARGPRCDPRRRVARRRDDLHGDDRRRDRSPRARHSSHDERGEDHRPHHRRLARGRARADEELPCPEPSGGRHTDPGEDSRRAGPKGHLRSIDDDQGRGEAHPDRSVTPDPEPDADGPRPRHATPRPGAAGGHHRARDRSR